MHHQVAVQHDVSGLDMRQLRHHTKNALASILAQISSELSNSAASRRIADKLERRVLLSARISDALFGLTRAPSSFAERLSVLCDDVVDLMGDDGQCIAVSCRVQGVVPLSYEEPLLRIAHEFVGNAVKHGMHVRLVGCIAIRVCPAEGGTSLTVTDDGWGCGAAPHQGEGMSVAAGLASVVGGRVSLSRDGNRTVACVNLPQRPQEKSDALTPAPGGISIG